MICYFLNGLHFCFNTFIFSIKYTFFFRASKYFFSILAFLFLSQTGRQWTQFFQIFPSIYSIDSHSQKNKQSRYHIIIRIWTVFQSFSVFSTARSLRAKPNLLHHSRDFAFNLAILQWVHSAKIIRSKMAPITSFSFFLFHKLKLLRPT